MLTYSPGDWHVVVSGPSMALLSPDVHAATLARIWESMRTGDGFAVVLGALIETAGADMSVLPSFAVVTRVDGAVRVIVRGAVHARVGVGDGAWESVSAAGVPTWMDRTVRDPREVVVIAVDRGDSPLPLSDGVAPAGSVTWSLSDAMTPRPAAPEAGEESAQSVPATAVPEPVLESEPTPDVASASSVGSSHETAVGDGGFTFAALEENEDPTVHDETSAYDDLIFGETRMSSVEEAAVRDDPASRAPGDSLIAGIPVRPAPAAPTPSPPPASSLGDHDGETISADQLAALQSRSQAATAPARGHATATLVVSTGERVSLDRNAVVGRRPRAIRATGVLPHLVTVPSPAQDISRNHVELRAEGADIVAVDLDTMNGTKLLRVGADPVRLHPGEPTLLVRGDRLDLGDGVVLAFEGV